MPDTAKIRVSSTQGAVPQPSDLMPNELALNTYDGKLWLRRSGAVTEIVDITAPGTFEGMSDVDTSQKTDGSVIYYQNGKFRADSNTFLTITDGGGF